MEIAQQVSIIQESISRVADNRIYKLIMRMESQRFRLFVVHKRTGYPVLELGLGEISYLPDYSFSHQVLESTFREKSIESDSGEMVEEVNFILSTIVSHIMDRDSTAFISYKSDEVGNFHAVMENVNSDLKTYIVKYQTNKSNRFWIEASNFLSCLVCQRSDGRTLFSPEQIEESFPKVFPNNQ
jgi:hypothetical protein